MSVLEIDKIKVSHFFSNIHILAYRVTRNGRPMFLLRRTEILSTLS